MTEDMKQAEIDALRLALKIAINEKKCAEARVSQLEMKLGANKWEFHQSKGKEPKGKKK